MNFGILGRIATVIGFLVMSGATALNAQSGDLLLRFDAGLVTPLGSFDNMVDPGPSFSGEVVYPFRSGLDLIFATSVDYLNNHDAWPVPDMRLWKYQVGVETTLVALQAGNYALRVFGKAGGAFMESDSFLTEFAEPVFPYPWERITKHVLAGSGGARLGFGLNSVLGGWLTGQLNYSPLNTSNLGILEEATNLTIEAPGSATTAAVRLGFSYRLGG